MLVAPQTTPPAPQLCDCLHIPTYPLVLLRKQSQRKLDLIKCLSELVTELSLDIPSVTPPPIFPTL